MTFDPIRRGGELKIWISFQVDPTGVGRRNQDVVLLDGRAPIASVSRRPFLFPEG